MPEKNIEVLEKRVERLTRQVRWMMLFVLLLFCLSGIALAMSIIYTPSILETERLMIYDKRGELRADIGEFAGRIHLTFLDEEGWVGLVLSVDDAAPELSGLKVFKQHSEQE